MNTACRRINTPFYGIRAFEILDSVHGQLSDGMWENSPGYDKYWTNFNVLQDVDGQVYFNVSTACSSMYCNKYLENPFYYMSDTEFLAWIANKVKAVIKQEAKDNNWTDGWWKRDNTEDTSIYLNRENDISVADIYGVYDWLKGRKNRCDDVYGARIYGFKRSPEEIAARQRLAYAKAKAREEFEKSLKELKDKFKADEQAIYDAYHMTLKSIDAEYQAA